jgi:hypothetical protein
MGNGKHFHLFFLRLTHRGGVSADVILAISTNAMHLAEHLVKWNAAVFDLTYMLRLHESSIMSLSKVKLRTQPKDDCSTGAIGRHGITARSAGDVRTDRDC